MCKTPDAPPPPAPPPPPPPAPKPIEFGAPTAAANKKSASARNKLSIPLALGGAKETTGINVPS